MYTVFKISFISKWPGLTLPYPAFKIPVSALLFVFMFCLSLPVYPAWFTGSHTGSFLSANHAAAPQPAGNSQAYLYYFYFIPRCDECMLLDKALGELLDKHYLEEIENGRLIFRRINLSDPDRQEQKIISDLRVRRQLLLLVSGEEKINLTREAFRFVERDPERFTQSVMHHLNGALE